MQAKRTIERGGFVRISNALGVLIGAVAAACWKLVAGRRVSRSSLLRKKPLDLSGTGGYYNARTGNYDNAQDPYGIYPDNDRRR